MGVNYRIADVVESQSRTEWHERSLRLFVLHGCSKNGLAANAIKRIGNEAGSLSALKERFRSHSAASQDLGPMAIAP